MKVSNDQNLVCTCFGKYKFYLNFEISNKKLLEVQPREMSFFKKN